MPHHERKGDPMLPNDLKQTADKARSLYQQKFRVLLEATHPDAFVCIEPDSEDYFLGDSLDEAVNKAMDAYPRRLTHTLRVGHSAALHIGVFQQ